MSVNRLKQADGKIVKMPSTVPVSEAVPRDVLLKAAADVMIEQQSIDISLSEIARKSGLNSALVKYYFGNKSGLLLALVLKTTGPSVAQLRELADMPISADKKIRLHIRGMISNYFRHPFLNRLLLFMLNDQDGIYAERLTEELVLPVARAQRQILEEGARTGIFKPVDPMLFYFHLSGACDALFHGGTTLKYGFAVDVLDETLKERYVEHLCSTFLSGICQAG